MNNSIKTEKQKGKDRLLVDLHQLFDDSPIAFYTTDPLGYLTSYNQAAAGLWGRDPVIGQDLWCGSWKIYYRDGTPMPLDEYPMAKTLKQAIPFENEEITIERPDHSFRNLLVFPRPIFDEQKRLVGAHNTLVDITAQAEARVEIENYNKDLEILNSIGKSISEKLDLKVTLQRVTDATTQLTGAAYGAFFYNDISETGKSMMLFTLSGAPREAFEKFGMPRHTDVFGPTLTGHEVVRVDDITKDQRYGHNQPYFGLPKGHPPVTSYLAVPVTSTTGSVIGGLFFGHPKSGIFKEEHEDMVINIAAQAAISLDNSKLFEQVQSLSKKKDEFIALASHELKTPLTTIQGYLQVLARKEQDQMSELFLNKSLNQVKKLNTLVEDLLHMSRVESGRLEFDFENFDIRQLLLNITESFNYSHQSHTLVHDLGSKGVTIEGDKQRIEQAVINLLNNAVKYSPHAEKVYLQLRAKDNNVVVTVKDQGIGLNKEQKDQLFTRFYRAESTKGISGLGLGLYLTKQIIDRHKGSIGVMSKLGEGSEFFFTLPLKGTR